MTTYTGCIENKKKRASYRIASKIADALRKEGQQITAEDILIEKSFELK